MTALPQTFADMAFSGNHEWSNLNILSTPSKEQPFRGQSGTSSKVIDEEMPVNDSAQEA